MPRPFAFVTVSNPTEPASSEYRRLTHSHAMRHVHSQKRRLRTQRYQGEIVDANMREGEKKLMVLKLQVSSSPGLMPANSKDPFSSLARPLSSVEYFLLNHYIQVVVPYSVGHCGLFDDPGDHEAQMLREWVGLAITDDALMTAAVLLSTCRYILRDRPDDPIFRRMALQYKQICLRTLRQEVEVMSSPVTVMTVAKALALAVDDVNTGEHSTARKHLQGVLTIVQLGGGPRQIGLTGLLERMYHSFLRALRLQNAEVGVMCTKTSASGQGIAAVS